MKMNSDDNGQDIRPALRLVALLGLAAILGLAGILGAARSSDHAPGPALEKLDRVLQHAVMQPADSRRGDTSNGDDGQEQATHLARAVQYRNTDSQTLDQYLADGALRFAPVQSAVANKAFS